ncbi:MAG TPA: alanine racemase, partial [Clostridia bacterium]|nr:alanine racemase [Clostridia bacterium]
MGIAIKLTLLVDLNAVRKNLEYIKARAGVKLLFMVKADAYGHGLRQVAKATVDLVDFFGVATVEEGILLRRSGIVKPILVTIFSELEAVLAVKYGLSVAVFSEKQIIALHYAVEKLRNKASRNFCDNKIKSNSASDFEISNAKVHLKIDSGMNRLGVKTEEELKQLQKCISTCRNVEVEGCYSHLYNVNEKQYIRFEMLAKIAKDKFPNAILHISSSGAVCGNGLDKFDMVRVGIAGYGYGDNNLKPVAEVVSQVIVAKQVKIGEHIGYGNFVAEHDCNIAVIFGGYADGITRSGEGYVE